MAIRAIHYDANGHDREIDLATEERPKTDKSRFLWIDVDDRNAADLRQVATAIELEPEALGRLAQVDRRARILRLPERVLLTLGAVDADDAEALRHELDIVIGPNHVVTVHDGPISAIEAFRQETANEGLIGRLDAASFMAGLLDAVLAGYFHQIEAIERDIDALDELAVGSNAGDEFLQHVLVLRRRIARLRRSLAPNREALLPLERPDFDLREDLGPIWPGMMQRLERALDGLENARELLVGSFDLYLGRASQRTNHVMKVLTLVSAIALPGIVLAGVMGMNFKLGFFDEAGNFFVVIAVMGILAGAILGVARWRDWI